jgi:hypothetical protein
MSLNDNLTTEKNAEDFRKMIQIEVLRVIKDLAHQRKMPKSKIRDIIKPGMTIDKMYVNAAKLDDKFSELAPVVLIIMKEYEEKYERKALDGVSSLIKTGHYNEAEEMVKKVLTFKISS